MRRFVARATIVVSVALASMAATMGPGKADVAVYSTVYVGVKAPHCTGTSGACSLICVSAGVRMTADATVCPDISK